MAKKKNKGEELPQFDVYLQSDGALVVVGYGTDITPEDTEDTAEEAGLVWSGSAVDKSDAIRQARKSDKSLKKAPTADAAYDPDLTDQVRKDTEERVNERLGIKPRGKKTAKKKSAAKSGAKKTAKKKSAKKAARRK